MGRKPRPPRGRGGGEMNTRTPRTDAAKFFAFAKASGNGLWVVTVEIAKQLERELAEAKAERDALLATIHNLAASHIETTVDRDKWRECAHKLRAAFDCSEASIERACNIYDALCQQPSSPSQSPQPALTEVLKEVGVPAFQESSQPQPMTCAPSVPASVPATLDTESRLRELARSQELLLRRIEALEAKAK